MPKDFNRESAAGAALPESDVHYPLIAEAATDAIITIDSDSTILVSPPRKGSSLLAAIDSARTRNRDDQGVS